MRASERNLKLQPAFDIQHHRISAGFIRLEPRLRLGLRRRLGLRLILRLGFLSGIEVIDRRPVIRTICVGCGGCLGLKLELDKWQNILRCQCCLRIFVGTDSPYHVHGLRSFNVPFTFLQSLASKVNGMS
jgi:hypothetical protein